MDLIDFTRRYDIERRPLDPVNVKGGAWHHTATRTPLRTDGVDREVAILDAIDTYHRSRRWRDWHGNLVSLGGFAYHLAVFPSERVYKVTPLRQRGAHVAGRNGELVAVVLIGTFTLLAPVTAQLNAALETRLLVEGVLKKALEWQGHRGWALPTSPTACPGNTFGAWVPNLSKPMEVSEVDEQARALIKALESDVTRLETAIGRLDSRLDALEGGAAPAPATTARYHTVVSGDVAGLIAEKYGLKWDRFVALNPGQPKSGNWSLIHPGERFRVG